MKNVFKKEIKTVTLCGPNEEVHNRLSGKKDFKKLIHELNRYAGSNSLKKLKFVINVVCGKDIFGSNFHRLNDIIRLCISYKAKVIHLNIISTELNSTIDLKIVADYISKARYVFLFDAIFKVTGLPYCFIPEPASVIERTYEKNLFFKINKCSNCDNRSKCDGILNEFKISFNRNDVLPEVLPKEVMVELTSKCNFNCKFCFNNASFSKDGYRKAELSLKKIKKIIDSVKASGVKTIRFTGGEPLLRRDIFEIFDYAKSKNLKIRLNTNGYLINSYSQAKKIVGYLDYALFSMHTYDPRKDEMITGVKKSYEKKIKAIKWFKRAGIKTIRVSTIANMDNINNLDKFYKLFIDLKIDKWATNRLIPTGENEEEWSINHLKLLVESLIKIRKDVVRNNHNIKIHIVNAVPLCALDPIKMNSVCSGARSVDGHERFVVDPRGFAKPIYYINKNIGDPSNIKACWEHPFMKQLRNYNKLPKECHECLMLEKCKGGNRYCAYMFSGSYEGEDPLMNCDSVKELI